MMTPRRPRPSVATQAFTVYRGLSPWLKVRVGFAAVFGFAAVAGYGVHLVRGGAWTRDDLLPIAAFLIVSLAALFGDGLKGVAMLASAVKGGRDG